MILVRRRCHYLSNSLKKRISQEIAGNRANIGCDLRQKVIDVLDNKSMRVIYLKAKDAVKGDKFRD